MKKCKKVVLAYSGGVDTSVAIRWLLENKAEKVIALAIDLGQGQELKPIQKKALQIGASESLVVDAKKEFINNYIWPALFANAIYGDYPLATALARPLIAKLLVEIAKEKKADAIAHGCTGKGNDQVRFDVSTMALAPHLKIIAPAREWNMTREKSIEYAKKHNIPVPVKKKSPFSVDLNLWGRSVECGILEDAWKEPPEEAYELTRNPKLAPGKPTYITVSFRNGIPTALNGKRLDGLKLIQRLNQIAGNNGVGRIDQIENRVVGIKSREVYESPAAVVLLKAHKDLESLVHTRETILFKQSLDQKYSQLIYDGRWFNPLRVAIDVFNKYIQKRVTGVIRVKLFKGNVIIVGRKSTYSLYKEKLATYGKGDTFDQSSAVGFIKLFGLDLQSLKSN
ncbi:MAG: argininosuccinate synthase [Candidatus Melainabacteria bacterium RIFCSPHIGHO2_02_FULL_34_12]|nr:MAG: argininosuccinate synthase [Candidatus Melainabacteria bacterium RIFCSPHIGHO2_02_FULL_34_12]